MHAEVRVSGDAPQERDDATARASSGDAATSVQGLPPLLAELLVRLQPSWSGCLVALDPAGVTLGELQCDAGWVVGARAQGVDDVFEACLQLCSRDDVCVTVVEGAGGFGEGALPGRVDRLPLTAAVVRGRTVGELDGVLREIGDKALKLRAHAALERYDFAPQERAVAELLVRHGPISRQDLQRRAAVNDERVGRVLWTLLSTGALLVVPSWLRVLDDQRAAARPDELTVVMPMPLAPARSMRVAGHPHRQGGGYSQHIPDAGVTAVRRPSNRPSAEGAEPAWQSIKAQQRACEQADAHFYAAEVLLGRGYARDAVLEAQKALRLCQPSPQQQALYAWLLYSRDGLGGRVEHYIWEHLERALQADPQCERALYYKAQLQRLAREGR